MQSNDFADINRALTTSVLEATFGMFGAWFGAFVSLAFILLAAYNFVPERPETLTIPIWLLPMLLWALPAMYAGGTFAGLSLAPPQIWKPMLLSIGMGTLVLMVALTLTGAFRDPAIGYFPLIVMSVIVTAAPTFAITLSVATNSRKRMRMQFRLTLAGIVVMTICWLAISITLPIAMRNDINNLAGDQPYQLYVPDQTSKSRYREFAAPPDFWTFQSILSAERTLQAHMCLYVGPEGSPRKDYHWSFFSGFRFLRNPENAILC